VVECTRYGWVPSTTTDTLVHDTELARTIPNVYQVDEPPRAELADVCLVIQPDADRSAVSRRPLGSRKGPDDESSGEMASGHYDSAMAQMRYGPRAE
jgi:hypothetical protein